MKHEFTKKYKRQLLWYMLRDYITLKLFTFQTIGKFQFKWSRQKKGEILDNLALHAVKI